MAGLDIITDAILDKAKAEAEAVLKQACDEKTRILEEAKSEALKITQEIEEESLKKIKNIEASFKAKAEQAVSRELLRKKSELIEQTLLAAKEVVYKMSDADYNKLLESLLSKYADNGKTGEILFSKKDKNRISDSLKEQIKKCGLELSACEAEIDAGFILRYNKVEENCSVEAIFHDKKEQVTDFLNKTLFC